ncbi:MAG: hypothetical protein HN737_03245 [Desulfobacterales bacterium]|jgi:hypothetical protein|nr:hypothetical protein [Desulfobacteraceae bacterium]MBT7086650.1 hypothetical protein [Desulfobacterales bacterium]MBT7696407.1 hypothetical protein [Desulfobacterales bacterium]
MSKYTTFGLFAWLGCFVIACFQAIEAIVSTGGAWGWKHISLSDVIGREYLLWVEGITLTVFQNLINDFISIPLIFLLFGAGLFLFIVNAFIGPR